MTNLPYREGGNIDNRRRSARAHLDSEAVWAALMAKLDLPTMQQRTASGAKEEN